MLTGLYVPGDSWLHRASPGAKLVGLLVFMSLVLTLGRPLVIAVGAILVLALGLGAGLGVRGVARLAWPLRWIVLLLTPVQLWTDGWQRAVTVVGGLVVTIVLAGVVTSVTRVADMMDTVVTALGPTRRLGVDPERIGLLFALAVRSIPVVAALLADVQQARAARGLDRSLRALLVPVVVRTVRHAERVGEALAARGVDD